jgi:YidC/Oxa1 family membrane protein insertase
MDRNQVIGISLLAVLGIGFLFYNQHEQKIYTEQKRADSVAHAMANPRQVIDSSKVAAAIAGTTTPVQDSATAAMLRLQPPAYRGQAETVTLENKKLSLQFTSKGAYPVAANIKDYLNYNKTPLFLFNGKGNQLSAILPVDNGKSTADLYFVPVLRSEPNGDKSVDFTADLGGGKKVDIVYTLPADDYMMRCNIVLTGIAANSLPLNWQIAGLHTEKDIASERQSARGGSTQIYYRNKNGDADYFSLKDEEKTLHNDAPSHWLGFRKQYFSTVLIADDAFSKMDVTYKINPDDSVIVAQNKARLHCH